MCRVSFLPDKNLQKIVVSNDQQKFCAQKVYCMKQSPAEVCLRLVELTFWAKSKLFRAFGCQICKWQACSTAKTKWDDSVFYQIKRGKSKIFLYLLKQMHLCSHKNELENCLQNFFPPKKFKVWMTFVIMTIYYGF